MSSPSASSSPAAASSVVGTETARLAWQAPLYLVVAIVVVLVIAGILWLIWNHDSTIPTCRRVKMESMGPDSTFLVPSASTLVQSILRYFFKALLPAFRNLRQATSSLASAAPRSQPALLPVFLPSEFREPLLAVPRPAMPRDSSSFRVPSNPSSSSEPSSLPASPRLPVFLGSGSAS